MKNTKQTATHARWFRAARCRHNARGSLCALYAALQPRSRARFPSIALHTAVKPARSRRYIATAAHKWHTQNPITHHRAAMRKNRRPPAACFDVFPYGAATRCARKNNQPGAARHPAQPGASLCTDLIISRSAYNSRHVKRTQQCCRPARQCRCPASTINPLSNHHIPGATHVNC